jgi:hypothetical protein
MGKRVLVAWLLFMQSPITFAQQDNATDLIERARMKYQLSVGVSVSRMQSNDKSFEDFLEQKSGYVIQGGISQYVGPRFDLDLLLSFSSKGNVSRAKSVNTNSSPPTTVESIDYETLNYVGLSLIPTYYLDKKCRLAISLGPYFAYQMSDKLYWEYYLDGVLSSKHTDYNVLGYKTFDTGIASDLSYRISFVNGISALLKLRWERGLFNISPGSGAAIYNQIFAFQIGVIL